VGGWRRFQVDALHPVADSAHVDALGQQVAPANVVILFVDYTTMAQGPDEKCGLAGRTPGLVAVIVYPSR
jgi:hypothetical protein